MRFIFFALLFTISQIAQSATPPCFTLVTKLHDQKIIAGESELATALALKAKADAILSRVTEAPANLSTLYKKIPASDYNGLVPFMLKNLELKIQAFREKPRWEIEKTSDKAFSGRVSAANIERANLALFAKQTYENLKKRASQRGGTVSLNLWDLIDFTDRYGLCMASENYDTLHYPVDAQFVHSFHMRDLRQDVHRLPVIMTRYATLAEMNTATALHMHVFFLPEFDKSYDYDGQISSSGRESWQHDWDHFGVVVGIRDLLNSEDLIHLRKMGKEHFKNQRDRDLVEAIYFYNTHEGRSNLGQTLAQSLREFGNAISYASPSDLLIRLKRKGDMRGSVRNTHTITVAHIRTITKKMLQWLSSSPTPSFSSQY